MSVNKVILIGNLGGDPEIRYLPDGKCVANFNIATTKKWKDRNSGERQEKTQWHRVVVFGKLAENCGEYLTKGSKVYIEGELTHRQYDDNQGVPKHITEVAVSMDGTIQFLDSAPRQGQGQQAPRQQQQRQGQQQGRQQQGKRQHPGQGFQQPQQGGFDDFPDDTPY